jgi:prolipoprotein diacylglyceryltransferase
MLLLVAFLLGAALGWHRARRRGGDRLDQAQYAAAHGILFALVVLTASIVGARLGLL